MRSRGWGFKIDYAKEIAADQANIAAFEAMAAMWALLTEEERVQSREPGGMPIWYIIVRSDPARLEALGAYPTAPAELAALYDHHMDGDLAPGWYQRAEALDKSILARFGIETVTEPRRELLAKFKADLARHKRNAIKYSAA